MSLRGREKRGRGNPETVGRCAHLTYFNNWITKQADNILYKKGVPLPSHKSLSDWQSLENLPGQGGKNTLNNIIIDNAEIFKPSKVKTSQRGGLEPLNKYLGEDAKENLFYNIDDIVERPLSDYSPSQVVPNHIITNFAEISTPCPSS